MTQTDIEAGLSPATEPEETIEESLSRLVALGLVIKIGDQYAITEAGSGILRAERDAKAKGLC